MKLMQNKALTDSQVILAREMELQHKAHVKDSERLSRISICKRFNVCPSGTFPQILAGRTHFPKSDITEDRIKGLLALYELGRAHLQVARRLSRKSQSIKFNVSIQTIHRLHGKNSCYQ